MSLFAYFYRSMSVATRRSHTENCLPSGHCFSSGEFTFAPEKCIQYGIVWIAVVVFSCGGISVSCAEDVMCDAVAGVPGQELQDRYDVIVVGAGTGGISAAVQAARLGATVLLVERTDWIGGQMAAAGVTSMDEGYPPRERVRERGIYGEFCRRASAYYAAIGKSTDTCAVTEDHFAVEPHVAQRILYAMIRDTRSTPLASGCPVVLDVLLRTEVVSVRRDDGAVNGVTVEIARRAKSRIQKEIRSKIVIDATEYGDIIPLTDEPYRVGVRLTNRKSEHKDCSLPVQPITWTAVIKKYPTGVPKELMIKEPPPGYNQDLIASYLSNTTTGTSRYPWTWKRFLQYRGMPDSASPFRAQNGSGLSPSRTHVNFLPNDQPFSVQDIEGLQKRRTAEYRARLRTLAVLYYFQNVMEKDDWSVANDVGYDSAFNRTQIDTLIKNYPELAKYRSVLYHFPVIPYARESRRIVGVYTLRAADIRRKEPFQPVRFQTAVAVGDYPVDVHGEHVDRELQIELDLDEPRDLPNKWIQWGYGPFQVPFESFIPKQIDGFLPAEKNLSQSRIASGATRLQPITMLTGQACGAIAGLACQLNVQPRDVPPMLVQKVLLDAGSTLSLTYYSDLVHGTELWKNVQLATLYKVIDFEGPTFGAQTPVTDGEIESVCRRLSQLQIAGTADSWRESVRQEIKANTREELTRKVSEILLTAVASGNRRLTAITRSPPQ